MGGSMEIELELLSPTIRFQHPGTNLNFSKSTQEIVSLTINGQYKECIQLVKEKVPSLNLTSLETIHQLRSSVKSYLSDNESSLEKELQILCFGISNLQLFVINNWTGPKTAELMSSLFHNLDSKVNEEVLQKLEVDGENVYPLIEAPLLLYIAKMIFQPFDLYVHCNTAAWWCLRYISIHQQLIQERAPSLHEISQDVAENLVKEDFLNAEQNRSYKIQLYLELGLLQLFYYQYKEAEESFQTATSLSGIQCSLDGALGVRTKFQQKSVAQLRVQITKTRNDELISRTPSLSDEDIPKALPLNDDTVLEKVKFSNDETDENLNVTAEDQAVILTMCTNMQKTSPSHKLRDEQLKCVIEYLLSDPKSWSIHTEALRVRCHLEKNKSRTVERSMMQLESLVKNITAKPKAPQENQNISVLKRLSLFYSVWPKSSWILEKQLAALFDSLGVRASALEIYMRLHMWEEAIVGLITTGRGHEAENLIKERLAVKESANLYCLLGDIHQDPNLYLKAWNISNQRSARAMRSLGAYKISKKLFKEAVECFEKSLAINYLQIGTWFSMGCATLADEDYEKAAKAFQRCVSLNWDNYEAWTNLSTAFVRCNKKNQAHRALTEALKCNFDRWELWENFLFVSADTGHFQDVVRAYNRLLDLKDKYIETSVLRVLVRAITEDLLDANEISAKKQKSKVLELFGRLTSKTTSNWEVWYLYSKLVGGGISGNNADESSKALLHLQKALRSALQRPAWEKDSKTAKQAVELSVEIIDACSSCHKEGSMNDGQFQSFIASTKLSINGVKAKIKMQVNSILNEESKMEFDSLAQEVEEKLKILNDLTLSSS